jgi:hypothetical protein
MPPRRTLHRWTAATALALALASALAVPGTAAAQSEAVQYDVLPAVTTDPLSIDVADDGRIIWTQRDGTLWVMTPEGAQIRAGQLAVSANACPTCLEQDEGETLYHNVVPDTAAMAGLEEGGLHSVLLARDFDDTGRLFLFRSMPGSRNPGPGDRTTAFGTVVPPTFGVFRLSSFVLSDLNLLDVASEEVLLEVPVEWDHCCHYGGQLNHLPDGTILLSTGDDADFRASNGYGPRDHRSAWTNAELSSANPADRRGKVLRLMPDGSVPDGSQPGIAPNPFVGHEGWNPYIPDTSGTPDDGWIAFDPYVYALGFKQPWRGTVHPSGTLLIDDVGPDATVDDPARGPRGYEEINAVPLGGGQHFGWPRCMADNQPYVDVDWETLEVGEALDCSADAPVSRPLPGAPSQVARSGMEGPVFAYGRGTSDEYPAVGSGGLTAEPVVVYPADADGPLRLPRSFDDRLIVLEFSRSIVYTIPTTPEGELVLEGDAVQRVDLATTSVGLPGREGVGVASTPRIFNPIDGAIGPDGAIYVLEYGASIYANPHSRLSRISCAGCAAADPAPDYGIELAGAALQDVASAGVLPVAVPWLAAALGSGAGLVWLRRRRHLV